MKAGASHGAMAGTCRAKAIHRREETSRAAVAGGRQTGKVDDPAADRGGISVADGMSAGHAAGRAMGAGISRGAGERKRGEAANLRAGHARNGGNGWRR